MYCKHIINISFIIVIVNINKPQHLQVWQFEMGWIWGFINCSKKSMLFIYFCWTPLFILSCQLCVSFCSLCLWVNVLVWHPKLIDISLLINETCLLINETCLQRRVNILTAHVLVSLKMGALCNADTTAMTAWRLFISHSFYKKFKYIAHTLSCAYNANIH